MANMSFQEYCEDIIDRQIGLMSTEERAEAYIGYHNWMTPKEKAAKHPDAGLKLAELKEKVARLLKSQKITLDRHTDKDLSIVRSFVEQAEAALNGKVKKADLLLLITLNSEASRHINSQL